MTDQAARILVARHNPQNGCYADDGEPLTVALIEEWPQRSCSHAFIGIASGKSSKYGWVAEAVDAATSSAGVNEHHQLMLDAIRQLPLDTPIAVSFFERGIESKHVDLVIHRVVFYRPR